MGHKSVCTSCRISFNNGTDFNNIMKRKCPQCKIEMINVSHKFSLQKKSEIKKWERDNTSAKYPAKYPENIKEAIVFVEKFKLQKTIIDSE